MNELQAAGLLSSFVFGVLGMMAFFWALAARKEDKQ